jgi:hypothetical protein
MNMQPGGSVHVDAQAVIQILTSKISALTLENAMLQARVMEQEAQLRGEKSSKAGRGGEEK